MSKYNFNNVVFDDWSRTDHKKGNAWSQVCKSCARKHKIDKRFLGECAGTPICGVQGCNNKAFYYIDFPPKKEKVYNFKGGF